MIEKEKKILKTFIEIENEIIDVKEIKRISFYEEYDYEEYFFYYYLVLNPSDLEGEFSNIIFKFKNEKERNKILRNLKNKLKTYQIDFIK